MIRLSISNIGWDAIDDIKIYDLMNQYGYEGLEIAPTRIFVENPYDRIDDAFEWKNKLMAEYGLSVPSMQSIWYGRTENIFESGESNKALCEYTQKAILFAEAVGCHNLVFGCPRNRNVPEGKNPGDGERFFRTVGEFATCHNTVIGMEANPPIYNTNYINTTQEAIKLIEKVNSKGFRLNLDVGTMIYNNEDVDVIKNKISIINHVHISEPGLKVIEKRNIHVELNNILQDGGYDGYVSIEMGKNQDRNSIENTMEYIKEIFGRG